MPYNFLRSVHNDLKKKNSSSPAKAKKILKVQEALVEKGANDATQFISLIHTT